MTEKPTRNEQSNQYEFILPSDHLPVQPPVQPPDQLPNQSPIHLSIRPPVQPSIQLSCYVEIMDLTSGKESKQALVTPSSILTTVKRVTNNLLSRDKDDWFLLDEEGQCINYDDIQYISGTIHLFAIPKKVLSVQYLECITASANENLIKEKITSHSLPSLSVEWSFTKIDKSRIQSILQKNDSFKMIKSIVVSDELTNIKGNGSQSY